MRSTKSSDAVYSYLKSIGRVPLLTHEEEIKFGKQVQAMVPLEAMREELTEVLQREPTQQEWADRANLPLPDLQRLIRRRNRAKHQMIEANLRLVVSIAKKYRSEEHTSELQSQSSISYAVFCLKKKTTKTTYKRAKDSCNYCTTIPTAPRNGY